MGTFYSVKIVNDQTVENSSALPKAIKGILESVNNRMSTYVDSSELSQLNRYPANKWFPLSAELFKVLKEAQAVSRLSNGAFDITVGPLVNLWGFGPEKTDQQVPSQQEISQRKALVGYTHLVLDEKRRAAKKDFAALYCDLSAIAKGYAVDAVADYLDSAGIDNFLVEVGGEVRAKGQNHKKQPWRIGVQSPDGKNNIFKIISISDQAVATSGDYLNYFEQGGIRYSHTIDPHTGKPITHKLASVTVIHESCMTADALATAIDVLGPQKGLALARELELGVFLIVKANNGFEEEMTPQFEQVILN